jgi:predicted  nucleic acid-binding Zn-ribbon protein
VNGPGLLALQLVDSRIDAIDGRRRRQPERAAFDTATAAHAALLAERARHQATHDAASRAIEDAERAGAELDTKQRRLEAQLKTVIAPREAEALMSEIAQLQAKHADLDDAELASMEQQAEAEAELASLAEREPALVAALDEARAALAAADAVLDAELADLTAQRAEAAAALAASEIATYDSLRRRHGGVAVAALEKHRCSACHVDLSPVEEEQVKATPPGELPECPHCARLLVV